FGTKPAAAGKGQIEFNAVYEQIIRPAIQQAGLDPIRADEEKLQGIIHKPMFERLILCDYAVADLTNANANVFYELGIRHAVRPYRTVLVSAKGQMPQFDLQPVRYKPYELDESGKPARPADDLAALAEQLRYAQEESAQTAVDSPIYQ